MQKIGRYEIIEEIGRGGMAVVYLARQVEGDSRKLALKMLQREFAEQDKFHARFAREVKTISQLRHPAIVPVYENGEVEGRPYLVMRYMPGGSLKERLEQGALDLEASNAIVERISGALQEAHDQGIVHRDLKPGNILFDEDGLAYLADFGIAKVLMTDETTLTATGMGVGTPAYMSPEQIQGGREIDGRSDIYALGVVLFEMLTGKKPYEGETPIQVIFKQVSDPIPNILQYQDQLPDRLEPVIRTVLAKSAEQRYQRVNQFSAALRDVVHIEREWVQREEAWKKTDGEVEEKHQAQLAEEQRKEEREERQRLAQLVAEKERKEKEDRERLEKEEAKRLADEEKKLQRQARWQAKSQPDATIDSLEPPARKRQIPYGWLLFAALVVGAGVLLAGFLAGGDRSQAVAAQPSATITETSSATPEPSATHTPAQSATVTPSVTPEPTATATLLAVETWVNPKDGAAAVYIPEGVFEMGGGEDTVAQPVYLEGFWIYQTEVTNAQYAACVAAEECPSLVFRISTISTDPDYPAFSSWNSASAYCLWAGGKLPTEAQWEKAARGGLEGKLYPWGDESPTCVQANLRDCGQRSSPVARFAPNGYGLFDMAGNAAEWVIDRVTQEEVGRPYNSRYPYTWVGNYHITKGGSYSSSLDFLKVAHSQIVYINDLPGDVNGFRCVVRISNP